MAEQDKRWDSRNEGSSTNVEGVIDLRSEAERSSLRHILVATMVDVLMSHGFAYVDHFEILSRTAGNVDSTIGRDKRQEVIARRIPP